MSLTVSCRSKRGSRMRKRMKRRRERSLGKRKMKRGEEIRKREVREEREKGGKGERVDFHQMSLIVLYSIS
jgi:hypothetical protein